MIPCGMRVSVAVWQPCELLYTCYLLTYHTPALHYTHSTACTRCGSVTGLLTFDLPAGLRAVQFTTSSRCGACCSRLGGRSGVSMASAGWAQSSAAPECNGPRVSGETVKIIFSSQRKSGRLISNARTLYCNALLILRSVSASRARG